MKKSRILAMAVLSMTLVAMINLSAVGAVTVTNGGFEDPAYSGDQLVPFPSIPGWTFAGTDNAGILPADVTGVWGIPTDGQCAAIWGGATLAQTISGSGTTTFTFFVQGYDSVLTVTLDDTPLTFGGTPSVSTVGGGKNGPMIQYTSDPITIDAGDHTLKFIAGSSWSFIDNVAAAVPEPACITLLTTGLIGLSMRARRKRI